MKKCPFCAREIKEEAIKCKHCKSWLRERPIANDFKIINPAPAHQNKRFLNLLLDQLFVAGLMFVCIFILAFVGLYDILQLDVVLDNDYSYLPFYLIYCIVMEYRWGKTLAKFVTKTKVIMKDGTKPSLGTIIGRTLCRLIPFEAFSFLGSHYPIGWHDRISNTIVIDEKNPSGSSKNNVKSLDEELKEKRTKYGECPKCGAPKDNNVATICRYCKHDFARKENGKGSEEVIK